LRRRRPEGIDMMKTGFALMAISAFLFAASSAPAWSQDQAPSQDTSQQKAQVQTVVGDLLKVDTEAKTITVKASDGAELKFTYNDATVIAGAQEGKQGLATAEGSKVTVHFTTTNEAHTATRIEVMPAK
jgi:hypothetical protein